jgi:predicted KAP-like P-loop ATPase
MGLKMESIEKDTLEKIKKSITDELDNTKLRENIRGFQNEFENLLKETNIQRLIVFIDELDRCNPDTILNTLEAIRLFLFKGNVSFVIGADERQIQYAVKRKFTNIEGIDFDIGKEYLEKLIQYPIKIPRLDGHEMELYISCLFLQKLLEPSTFEILINGIKSKIKENFYGFQLNFDEVKDILHNNIEIESIKDSLAIAQQLSTVLTNGLYGNPRQCKRFLNSLAMRESMAKFKGIAIKRNVLAKIMMLEYFKPQLFKKFAKLYDEKNLIKELELVEEKGISQGELLKEWENDEWIDIWLKSSPSLHGINDLRPYFYLTRDALVNRVVSNPNKLSPQALEIINMLKSKSDLQINNALKKAEDISDHEAREILSSIFNELLSDSSGDTNSFKAFIRWGTVKKSLYGETSSLLRNIPQNIIKLSFIPLLEEFGEKTNQKIIIIDWLRSMKFDGSISKAIEELER